MGTHNRTQLRLLYKLLRCGASVRGSTRLVAAAQDKPVSKFPLLIKPSTFQPRMAATLFGIGFGLYPGRLPEVYEPTIVYIERDGKM